MLKITVKNQNAAQYQLEYAMYMMLSSYFKKASCKSRVIEKSLFLYYKDLTDSKQYEIEDRCLKVIDNHILPSLIGSLSVDSEAQLATLDCNISIRNEGNKHVFFYRIENGAEFRLTLLNSGKHIEYELSI